MSCRSALSSARCVSLLAGWLLFFGAAGCAVSEVGSIGVVLGRDPDDGAVFVREIPPTRPGAPAQELTPGDELLMVDGHYVRPLNTEQLRAMLRGVTGSKVRLTVSRGGDILRLEVDRVALQQAVSVRGRDERLE